MPLERSQIYELRKGRAEVAVGPLPPVAVTFLGAAFPTVYLSAQSLRHIESCHPDISELELVCASAAIWDGLLIGYENIVIASYLNPDSGQRYKAAVKSAQGGFDLWLTTFHRLSPRQTKRLLRRGTVLKPHY
jgi:hypothetical protein